MPRHAPPVTLSEADQLELERWVGAHRTPQQIALRCRIILAAAQGQQNQAIAAGLGTNPKTVALWRRRFLKEGAEALWEVAPGRGRKRTIPAEKVAAIVAATLQTRPAAGTHWSCRTMAKAQGVSKATIQRVWQAHQLQPHRTKTFKRIRIANPVKAGKRAAATLTGMSILLGLGRLPSGGRQFGDPVDGPAAELGQYLGQVFPQVDVQATAGFNDRRDGRHFRPGFRTPKVQPVLAAKGQWAHATFAPVVVDLHQPVLQIDFQPAPLAQCIIAGLGQFGSRHDLLTDRHQPLLQRIRIANPV